VTESGSRNPVRLSDYAPDERFRDGRAARELAVSGARVLVPGALGAVAGAPSFPLAEDVPHPVVVSYENIGIMGVAAGEEVFIADVHGLADWLGARLDLPLRGRPGHERFLPTGWLLGRFAAAVPDDPGLDAQRVEVRRVLGCGPVAELEAAVTEPLTVGRFFSNILASPRFTFLGIPADPASAAAEMC
jgi:arabinofuranosyltransferase